MGQRERARVTETFREATVAELDMEARLHGCRVVSMALLDELATRQEGERAELAELRLRVAELGRPARWRWLRDLWPPR